MLYQLHAAIQKHFANVRSAIHTYSLHNTKDHATAQFYSNLSLLERLLANAEKKTHIREEFESMQR